MVEYILMCLSCVVGFALGWYIRRDDQKHEFIRHNKFYVYNEHDENRISIHPVDLSKKLSIRAKKNEITISQD